MPTPTSPSAASGADRAEMVRMSSPENNGNGPSTSGGHQSRDGDSADSVEHQFVDQCRLLRRNTFEAVMRFAPIKHLFMLLREVAIQSKRFYHISQ